MNANSRVNKIFFSGPLVRGAIFPLPFTVATFGAKFLCASVVSLSWVKCFVAKPAKSFFQNWMGSDPMAMMMFPMTASINNFKIFKSVISSNTVNMVDVLRCKKLSSNVFGHYIAMLKRLNCAFKHRVTSRVYQNIPVTMHGFSTIPVGVILLGIYALNNAINSGDFLLHGMIIDAIYNEVNT